MDRRQFLRWGQSSEQTPWAQCCARVARTVGAVQVLTPPDALVPHARVQAKRLQDFYHLRALCGDYGVTMAIDAPDATLVTATATSLFRPTLWVAMPAITSQALPQHALWASPWQRVGDLAQQGFAQFRRIPPDWTLAQWFASPWCHDQRTHYHFLSGVERLEALFADGTQAMLGGFGVQDDKALATPLLQQVIPALFEYMRTNERLLQSSLWSQRLRLDSLHAQWMPINLARLFQGSGARLCWPLRFCIRPMPQDSLQLPTQLPEPSEIDAQIKALFDPDGLWPFWEEGVIEAQGL